MKDFAGNELEVGQKVICLTAGRSTSWMIWAEVIGFTPQKVKVLIRKQYNGGVLETVTLRDHKNVVLPMTPRCQELSPDFAITRCHLSVGHDGEHHDENGFIWS